MRKNWLWPATVPAVLTMALLPGLSQKVNPFAGRWDMTVTAGGEKYPSWIEVMEKGGTLDARVQQRTGNVAPVAGVKMDGARLIVTVSAAVPSRPAAVNRPVSPGSPEVVWELTEKDSRLTGVQKQGEMSWPLVGVRAPALKRAAPKAWSDPEPLFNGKDLTGWSPVNNTPEAAENRFTSHWVARNGELTNDARGSNLRTTRVFDDFKLHAEFSCPPEENSGIYLRGRYEAQVAPPPTVAGGQGQPPAKKELLPGGAGRGGGYRNPFGFVGCIYGMLGPSSPPPFNPEWQVYDITLVGRWVTVVFNGVTTIDNQEIAGPTGGALDTNEGEPGPIYLQGDHHGGIRYRNITISVPKR
ncbi:MAG: DUF1080 domain-containing protein [Acidobacteriia bacterium]|nr:DUF1080 domain-containing protein [Terriglobia bacterium]